VQKEWNNNVTRVTPSSTGTATSSQPFKENCSILSQMDRAFISQSRRGAYGLFVLPLVTVLVQFVMVMVRFVMVMVFPYYAIFVLQLVMVMGFRIN
jgi:hypothetical protein